MQEFIDLINQFIRDNQGWAGPLIGLLCFGESLFIIGIMIPASSILIFTGTLIGAGTLSPLPILLWGAFGAILGDIVSYSLGRYLGWDFVQKPAFKRYAHFLLLAKQFFEKHGTLSVFLGRFMGPVRSTIPTLAGLMGLGQVKFQIANITSAFLWLPLMMAPGYFAAKGAQTLAENSGMSMGSIISIASVVLGVGMTLYFFLPRKASKSEIIPNEKILTKDSDES